MYFLFLFVSRRFLFPEHDLPQSLFSLIYLFLRHLYLLYKSHNSLLTTNALSANMFLTKNIINKL